MRHEFIQRHDTCWGIIICCCCLGRFLVWCFCCTSWFIYCRSWLWFAPGIISSLGCHTALLCLAGKKLFFFLLFKKGIPFFTVLFLFLAEFFLNYTVFLFFLKFLEWRLAHC